MTRAGASTITCGIMGLCVGSVFGDVEILLNKAPRICKERPIRADTAAIFVGLRDAVYGDRERAAGKTDPPWVGDATYSPPDWPSCRSQAGEQELIERWEHRLSTLAGRRG